MRWTASETGGLPPRSFAAAHLVRYPTFDRLCRTTYDEFVPDWPDPIVPWDQLLAMRSRTGLPDAISAGAAPPVERGCGAARMVERLAELRP